MLPTRFSPVLAALLLLALLPSPRAGEEATPPPPVTSARAEEHHLAHRLLKDIEEAVARVDPWLQRYGYGAVFVLVGVEGFGIPAPGQTILEAGAAASAAKGSRLRIHWLVLTAFLAASLGATLGYLIGRTGGRRLLKRLRIPERHLDRVESAFDRYGVWLIVLARFFDGTRQLHGIAAGVLGMPWVRFLIFNLVGAALWACFWGLLVYYLDLHLDQVVSLIRRLNPWVATPTVGALIALLGLLWMRSVRDRRSPP
ncbi:MAG: DedA family protein [Chromatiaceae bacterium]|jgi:membrane protein DedA with SNARE-associated domain